MMRLSSILLSRVVAISGLGETNPFGRVFLPVILPQLVKKYSFQKYPESLKDLNLADGLTFELGYSEECGTINKLIVYADGMTIESQSHSAKTKAALEEIFRWAAEYGVDYVSENRVKRWLYVTSLLFYSDADLDLLNPVLTMISDAMQEYAISIGRPRTEFKTTRISIDFDHSNLEFPHAPFLLERDKTARFGEYKFFSESPMPSEQHLKLLEDVERQILERKSRIG